MHIVPNAACPPERKQSRFTDAGGLCLQVSPSGSKLWFYKNRKDGKEKQLALGSYPDVNLTANPDMPSSCSVLMAVTPIQARKLEKIKGELNLEDTFQAVTLE